MEDSLNFSKLTNFLHQTLVFTEEAKDVLKSNCDEAMYCLKPLYTEIYPQQEVNKDVCTCVKTKTEVEEIAAGISRALIQTQQLREKLSSNVTEKSPKCYNMYEYSQATGSKTQKNVKNLNLNNKNIYSKQNLYGIKSNIQKTNIDKVQSEIAQRDQLKKTKNNNKQLVTHPKLSGSKNFLAINKRNIKNIKEVKDKLKNNVKSNTSITKSKCIKFDERNSAASTSELKNLIQKMTVKSGDCTLSNECNIKCPLHENKISQYTCEQNLTVKTFVDCLNTTDIPEEIIKSLKVYHKFLNIEYTEKSFSGKQKELHTFLVEFNKMNEIVQKKFVHKNYIINALFKFISLFQYLFSKTMKIDLEDIRSLYTELSSPWKVYELKEFKNKQILKNDVFKTPHIVSNMKGYMSNGIWNSLYNKNLEEMSKIYCIRYTSKDQLLLFFDIIQQFQHIQYYNDLIKIIAEDILPNMNAFFDCTQSEYVKIYKMIFILYQGLNPKIPILVRTDK